MKRYIALLCLIAVMLFAGCISPPGSTDTSDTNNTTQTGTFSTKIIQDLSLQRSTIFEGSSTTLLLTLQNTRSHPLQQVMTEIGNRGNLQFSRQVPSEGGQSYECRYDTIAAGTRAAPTTRRCVWSITAPGALIGTARDAATFPLTAFVTFSSSASATQRSLQADFERQQDITPGDTTVRTATASNRDVFVSLRHSSPIPAEPGEVPMTITVRNQGDGTIVSGDQERRGVTVFFEGTLADANWNMQESTCSDGSLKRKAIFFQAGRDQAQVSCTISLAEGSLAGKTFFLRPRIEYRYRVSQNVPISVVKRN